MTVISQCILRICFASISDVGHQSLLEFSLFPCNAACTFYVLYVTVHARVALSMHANEAAYTSSLLALTDYKQHTQHFVSLIIADTVSAVPL